MGKKAKRKRPQSTQTVQLCSQSFLQIQGGGEASLKEAQEMPQAQGGKAQVSEQEEEAQRAFILQLI